MSSPFFSFCTETSWRLFFIDFPPLPHCVLFIVLKIHSRMFCHQDEQFSLLLTRSFVVSNPCFCWCARWKNYRTISCVHDIIYAADCYLNWSFLTLFHLFSYFTRDLSAYMNFMLLLKRASLLCECVFWLLLFLTPERNKVEKKLFGIQTQNEGQGERESEQKGMKNRLCDDNGWNGVGAIKKLHSNIIINSNGYVHSFAQQ